MKIKNTICEKARFCWRGDRFLDLQRTFSMAQMGCSTQLFKNCAPVICMIMNSNLTSKENAAVVKDLNCIATLAGCVLAKIHSTAL